MTILRRNRPATDARSNKNRRRTAQGGGNRNVRAGDVRPRDENRGQQRKNRKRTEGNESSKGRGNRRISTAERAEKVETAIDEVQEATPQSPPREPRWPKMLPVLYSMLRFLAVVLSILAVVWGGKLIYSYATTSTYFAVQHIEINGNERLSNSEVIEAAKFSAGDNIFSVDLLVVEKNLKEQPWIVNAKVRQQLPKTIIIDIVERKPEIMVLVDVPYLVDETGEIFKRWSTDDPLPDCVITGITKIELIEDLEGAQKIVLDAISLRERYNTIGNNRYAKLFEIHREFDGGFSLSVGDDPFYIKLGKPPYRKKLTRLAQLLRKISREGKQPQIVYFDNEKRPDRVTVKMKPSDAEK